MPPAFIECVKFETQESRLFTVEFCLKCCDVGGGGGGGGGGEGEGVNVNVIMTLMFPQGLWTSLLITNEL